MMETPRLWIMKTTDVSECHYHANQRVSSFAPSPRLEAPAELATKNHAPDPDSARGPKGSGESWDVDTVWVSGPQGPNNPHHIMIPIIPGHPGAEGNIKICCCSSLGVPPRKSSL